jgi:glycosyltransferase involved in cell wall biosynthesis
MKLLMLAPEFLPLKGGIGTYIVELIKNMPQDIEIHVLTPKRNISKEQIKEVLSDKCIIHNLGIGRDDILNNSLFQMNCRKYVPSFIKKYDIDIIHSQSSLPDLFLSPKTLDIPIITTIHTTIHDEIYSTQTSNTNFFNLSNSEKTMLLVSPLLKMLENNYYSKHRNYITVSNWMKNRFLNDFKKIENDKVKVIYNGVDSTLFNPTKNNAIKKIFPELSDISVPKILFLSRWVERKGIRFFMKAIPEILKKTDVHFVFAGPNKNNSIRIPSKNCSFLGYVPQENLPCLYASCEIFLLPSLLENFPFVLLEAMSSGSAVISTNVGGIPEMITHNENGLLIRPKHTEDIVNSVTYLAENNKIRDEISKKARKTIEERFNWDKIALATYEYYKKILTKQA